MNDIFVLLAIVLGLATIFGFLIKKINLPILVSYLLVGVAISAFSGINFTNSAVAAFPNIGIAFVLFLVGMELDLRELRSIGKPVIISGIIQISLTTIAGTYLATLFGFRGVEAMYLGVGLSFSSTVVIVKLLLERKDLTSLYGKIVMGITLLEDMVAMMFLMFFSMSSAALMNPLENPWPFIIFVVRGIAFILLAYTLSKLILDRIFSWIDDSPELIFLASLSWCFLLIIASLGLGFSAVIGAFIAGITLAPSPFHYHVSGKIKPLRDFFIVMFFVYIGSQVVFSSAVANLGMILTFTIYALLLKPFIYLLLLASFGFRKHTIFQSAVSLSQISEFSLIILLVGFDKKIVSHSALSSMALTVTISIICSSILIKYSKAFYKEVRNYLDHFERQGKFSNMELRVDNNLEDHIVVIGAHKIGGPIVEFLRRKRAQFMVLDFNPTIIEELRTQGIQAIYGDLGDPEVLENLKLDRAKLVISTVNDVDDNRILLSELHRLHSRATKVIRVDDDKEGRDIQKRGADFVLLPESVSANFLVEQLKANWPEVRFKDLT